MPQSLMSRSQDKDSQKDKEGSKNKDKVKRHDQGSVHSDAASLTVALLASSPDPLKNTKNAQDTKPKDQKEPPTQQSADISSVPDSDTTHDVRKHW